MTPKMMAEWSWTGLKENIIDGHINRQWLSINDKKETLPLHETLVKPDKIFDRQTSFILDSVQVTVRRYEWFTTVKSMYNAQVNALLQNMSRNLGGIGIASIKLALIRVQLSMISAITLSD